MERIGAHCSNIAVAMIEIEDSEIASHSYLKSVKELKDDEYMLIFDEYTRKYDVNKKENDLIERIDTTRA